jgi:hypothetical protein
MIVERPLEAAAIAAVRQLMGEVYGLPVKFDLNTRLEERIFKLIE